MLPSDSTAFTVIEKNDYVKKLEWLISHASHRVWVQTMTFDSQGKFLTLKRLLEDAAQRGVDTRYTVDAYYRMIVDGSIYYLPLFLPTTWRRLKKVMNDNERALADLVDNKVRVTITNSPSSLIQRINPACGRNHIKLVIVDDVAFIGDVHHFVAQDQHGMMVEIHDPYVVMGLERVYIDTARMSLFTGGQEVTGLAKHSALLIDDGLPGRSLIMNRCHEAIRAARRSVVITGQYFPDGNIVRTMQEVKERGVSVIVAVPGAKGYGYLDRLFYGWNRTTFKLRNTDISGVVVDDYMHSNILLVDEDLSSAQALVGTRCFSERLVRWGSREVALRSRDPDLVSQLREYVGKFGVLT